MTIVAPRRASSRAVTAPSPLLAPVMMTVRSANDGRSAAVQPVMADNTNREARRTAWRQGGRLLLRRDDESVNDLVDVARLRGRLIGETGDGQLHQITLACGR